jgi:hypothetical protein
MPIRPFLGGQGFDPETIAKMSAALESVCEALSLKFIDDAATRLIAQKIIEPAERGVKDVATLRAMTLEHFRKKNDSPPREEEEASSAGLSLPNAVQSHHECDRNRRTTFSRLGRC